MKKTIYNAFFSTILFHIFLNASNDQAEVLRLQIENERNWRYITNTVFSCHNFPQILKPLQDSDPEIHRIIGNNLGRGCHQRLPISYGRDRKCMSDPIVFDSVQKTIIDNIIDNLNRYALRLEHHQQTKKSEPTPEELAQAAEKFAAAAVAADQAMQDFLAEEAQERSIVAAAKKNNGKSKKTKKKK